MQTKRFLNIILMSCSILMNNSNANKFIIIFHQSNGHNEYCIKHDNMEYVSNNIKSFSQELKNISKEYFDFSSMKVDCNTQTIKLNNFKSFKDYTLCFRGSNKFILNIIIDYRYNDLKLPSGIELDNINLLKIYSNSSYNLQGSVNTNINDFNKIFLNDKLMPLKYCNLVINNTQITDITAVSNITKKLLYNTKPESVMDIMYFIWYVMKAPLKWVGLLK